MRFWQRTLAVLVVAVAAASARNPMRAQAPVQAPKGPAWTVSRDPFTDLWFHCLALIGYEGYGPLTLYDHTYASRTRVEKRRAGVTTTLDTRATELRAAFANDSAFEVLHFVPLYFVGREPRLALAELRRAATSPVRSSSTPAQLIAAALATPHERTLFLAFIQTAEAEWTSYLQDRWAARAGTENASVQELETRWADRFAAPLDPYLDAVELGRGVIIVSPAVGIDGRFVRDGAGSAIVVVSSDRSGVADAPLIAAVRELTFPLLDRLHARLSASAARIAAARARDIAAVRAGALVLDATDHQLAAEYRRRFLQLTTRPDFENAYPIDPQAESELRELIAAMVRTVATGGSYHENR